MDTDPVRLSSSTLENLHTETQRVVAAAWADVLKMDAFEIDDDFFEIGGNSMTATLVTYSLREKFDCEFPLMLIFENATIVELADAIDKLLAEKGNDD